MGWITGDHILDTDFDLEKNIINDTLQVALRVDTNTPPANLMRAYMKADLEAAAKENPSGHPSARQRKEARANARERLEEEAKDGRFLKRKSVAVMWDRMTSELAIGATSQTMIDRVRSLFADTFNRKIEQLTAGLMAYNLAEASGYTSGIDDAKPEEEIVWVPDFATRDFLGNEFMLWLWWILDTESDSIELQDSSEVTLMFARYLALECPRGQSGKEAFASDGPTRLPEAKKAIQTGKLPRKAGLTMVRHDKQYEFALIADTLAVCGCKMPAPEAEDERARIEERVSNYRDFCETLDLLYEAFLRRRAGRQWEEMNASMKRWVEGGAARKAMATA